MTRISTVSTPTTGTLKPQGKTAPAIAVQRSADVKLSQMKGKNQASATHVAQDSCPKDCPFFNRGCYAESHRQGMVTRRLNGNAQGQYTPRQLAHLEAKAIRGLRPLYDLRLHVVGDCQTPESARIVAEASEEYMERSGKTAWTYTHAWKDVPRKEWGRVSVLASVQTKKEAGEAFAAGYAPALVVKDFADAEGHWENIPLRGVPCPHQTGKAKSCVDCRLCLNDTNLKEKGVVILFQAHGLKSRIEAALDAVS